MKLLEEIEAVMGPERPVFVARELTKKFEELLSGTPAEIRQRFGDPRGGGNGLSPFVRACGWCLRGSV